MANLHNGELYYIVIHLYQYLSIGTFHCTPKLSSLKQHAVILSHSGAHGQGPGMGMAPGCGRLWADRGGSAFSSLP